VLFRSHIAPGAHLGGDVMVGEGTLVGLGASVLPQRHIGKWAVIGAGAVVVKDIPDYAVAVGNPAKIIKVNE
jgi:acetyltransferase-like isoleucine patch superfamily enzyme